MNNNTVLIAAAALIIGLGIGWIASPKMGGMNGMMNHDMSQMGGQMDGMMGGQMDGMGMSKPKGDQGPSSMAFARANGAMHTGMAIEFTGNSDVDFAKGMIPHHNGAVEMAKIELQYGKDVELRKLASDIIAAQETEIKFMMEWLAKNAK